MFTNLLKSVIAVAVAPVDLVVDIVTLLSTALDGEDPFKRTSNRLAQAGDALNEALKPDAPQ